jgi:hypothetical protein
METIAHETAITEVLASNRTREDRGSKLGQSKIPNRTIRFPRIQQRPLDSSVSSGFASPDLLLMVQGAIRVRQD